MMKIRRPRKKNALRKALSFLFPDRCPYCYEVIETGAVACPDCEKELLTDFEPITRGVFGCRCVSAFRYEGKPRKAVLGLKYYEKFAYVTPIAALMRRCIESVFDDLDFDVIAFVPMHRKDQKKRGFNQSRMLAFALCDLMQIPCADALEKIKHTEKQHELTASERRKNLIGAFRLKEKDFFKDKNVLVVDDIVTTGATLSEIAKVITRSKPGSIRFVTFCNASLDDRTPEPLDG